MSKIIHWSKISSCKCQRVQLAPNSFAKLGYQLSCSGSDYPQPQNVMKGTKYHLDTYWIFLIGIIPEHIEKWC